MREILSKDEPFPQLPWNIAVRLNSFRQDGSDVLTALRRVARVSGVSAVELNYPQHFRGAELTAFADLLAELRLPVTAINMRFDDPRFRRGAFTAPEAKDRELAITWARDAVEMASRFEAKHLILWMENDGWDYPLQANYDELWHHEMEGLRVTANHDPNVRVSVEYKPYGSRRFALIRSMSDALLATHEIDAANFGVTIDLCHSYMAGEHPPASAAAALRAGKLFGVHLNDGGGLADDGLMFAAIHEREALELLTLLLVHEYRGTLYFDTFPEREDPAIELAANIARLRNLASRAAGIDRPAMRRAQAAQDVLAVNAVVESS